MVTLSGTPSPSVSLTGDGDATPHPWYTHPAVRTAAAEDTAPPELEASAIVRDVADVLTSDAVDVPTAWASLFDRSDPLGDVASDEQAASAMVPRTARRRCFIGSSGN